MGELIFIGLLFTMLVTALVGKLIHRRRTHTKNGRCKCSVCGNDESTMYYYHTFWGTEYHCFVHSVESYKKDKK